MAYIPFNNISILYTHIPELWPTFPPTTYLYYVYTHIPELWPTFPTTVVALQRSLPV